MVFHLVQQWMKNASQEPQCMNTKHNWSQLILMKCIWGVVMLEKGDCNRIDAWQHEIAKVGVWDMEGNVNMKLKIRFKHFCHAEEKAIVPITLNLQSFETKSIYIYCLCNTSQAEHLQLKPQTQKNSIIIKHKKIKTNSFKTFKKKLRFSLWIKNLNCWPSLTIPICITKETSQVTY